MKNYPLGNQFVGWWPARYDAVQFGYTVLGTATLSDAEGDLAATTPLGPRLTCANPLRRGAIIAFAISHAGSVRIDFFDVAGRRVRVLQDGHSSPGRHELRWNGLANGGGSLPAGLYLIRLESQGRVINRKLVVLK